MLHSTASENIDAHIQDVPQEIFNTCLFDIVVYSITPTKCVKWLNWEACQFSDSLDMHGVP